MGGGKQNLPLPTDFRVGKKNCPPPLKKGWRGREGGFSAWSALCEGAPKLLTKRKRLTRSPGVPVQDHLEDQGEQEPEAAHQGHGQVVQQHQLQPPGSARCRITEKIIVLLWWQISLERIVKIFFIKYKFRSVVQILTDYWSHFIVLSMSKRPDCPRSFF